MMTVDEEEEARFDEEEFGQNRQDWSPDFNWLTDHIALGARFPMDRAGELASAHGIAAVVDLRSETCDDARALEAAGIDFLHLPTPDLEPPSQRHLDRGVMFVRERTDRGEKVLIHCQHGIGRSALLALCALVDQGWEPLDALAHAKDRRWVVSPSEAQYAGWSAWLGSRGVPAPDYHSFGCIAYRHLAAG